MMGPTIVFPFRWRSALSNLLTVVIWRSGAGGHSDHSDWLYRWWSGSDYSGVQINGQPVEFTFALILIT